MNLYKQGAYLLKGKEVVLDSPEARQIIAAKTGCTVSKEEAKKHLKYIQKNDKIKNEYCKKNNIKLIRLPFWYFCCLVLFPVTISPI